MSEASNGTADENRSALVVIAAVAALSGVLPGYGTGAPAEGAGYDGFYSVELSTGRYGPEGYPGLPEACVRGARDALESAAPQAQADSGRGEGGGERPRRR